MSRYEITDGDHGLLQIRLCDVILVHPGSDYWSSHVCGAIRQQQADIAALKDVLAGEVEANQAFRRAGGALDGEDMPTFCARLLSNLASMTKARDELGAHLDQFIAERDQLRAKLAAVDSAPTVAKVCLSVMRDCLCVTEELDARELPRLGTELIARPAKDGRT